MFAGLVRLNQTPDEEIPIAARPHDLIHLVLCLGVKVQGVEVLVLTSRYPRSPCTLSMLKPRCMAEESMVRTFHADLTSLCHTMVCLD